MEVLLFGCLVVLVVVCAAGGDLARRRANRLKQELAENQLEERFDSHYRLFDERYENLKRDTAAAREALQREVQANIESLSKFNDNDHNDILSRLNELEDRLDSKKSKR